ncbi:unnamed protein product [Linum trigynum]|uniref:Uncharacterized protein n=1 Tax=Linum trigynum TaxID=586398 RepID=A0AAV2C8W5_9ROSI
MIGGDHAVKFRKLRNLKHLNLKHPGRDATLSAYVWSANELMSVSPGLPELTINIGKPHKSGEVGLGVMAIDRRRRIRPELKRVKVNQFDGTRLEMAFVRSIVGASPALDKMEIEFSAGHGIEDQWSISQELLHLTRASPTARITIK